MLKKFLRLRIVIIIAICLTSSASMFAQDIIILRNGNEIQAVVQEIGLDAVTYRRYDNQDGPIHSIRRSEIFMIRFANGTSEVFTETPSRVNHLHPELTYMFGRPISPQGGERSPFVAGLLSAVLPGIGQFYNGDNLGGAVFLGAHIVCYALMIGSIGVDSWGEIYFNETMFLIGGIGFITNTVWSVVHASRGARNVNIVRGFQLADNTHLQIQPTVIQTNYLAINQRQAHGVSLSLRF